MNTAALALTLAKNNTQVAQQRGLIGLAREVSSLLSRYPNPKFHLLVESFLSRICQRSDKENSPRVMSSDTSPNAISRKENADSQIVGGHADVTDPLDALQENYSVLPTSHLAAGEQETEHDEYLEGVEDFQDKQLEIMLGMPAESWFLDPFSIDNLSFDDT